MYVPTFGWLFVGKLVDKCTVRYMDPMGIEGEDILSVPKHHFIILASFAAHQLNLARGWSINQTPVEPQKKPGRILYTGILTMVYYKSLGSTMPYIYALKKQFFFIAQLIC